MKRKRKVQILKEELYLFDYLFRHRVATGKAIHRDVYTKYKSFETTRNRLVRLRKNGLIKGRYFNLESRDMCYRLTSATVKKYIDFSKNAYVWKGTNSPGHDIDLIDIWKTLKNRDIINYMLTEHEYNVRDSSKCCHARSMLGELRPDGFLEITLGDESFVATLEYEKSPKSNLRYLEMIDRYYRNKEVKVVFYISEEKHVENQVKRAELEYRTRSQEPKFFYAMKKDVLCSDDIIFRSVGDCEYEIKLRLTATDRATKVANSVALNSMQSIENIRENIVEDFFDKIPSSPLCREYNNKPQTTINETGGLNGN